MTTSLLDARHPPEEDYQRLILEDLLYFFPGPYAMLSAYLDESWHARGDRTGRHGRADKVHGREGQGVRSARIAAADWD